MREWDDWKEVRMAWQRLKKVLRKLGAIILLSWAQRLEARAMTLDFEEWRWFNNFRRHY